MQRQKTTGDAEEAGLGGRGGEVRHHRAAVGRAVRMVCGTYGGCGHAGDAADAFPADCLGDSGVCASL